MTTEQGIPREHLSKMIALQKQTMSELYEKNVQLRKDKVELVGLLQKLIDPNNCKKDIIHIIGNAESLLGRLEEK